MLTENALTILNDLESTTDILLSLDTWADACPGETTEAVFAELGWELGLMDWTEVA